VLFNDGYSVASTGSADAPVLPLEGRMVALSSSSCSSISATENDEVQPLTKEVVVENKQQRAAPASMSQVKEESRPCCSCSACEIPKNDNNIDCSVLSLEENKENAEPVKEPTQDPGLKLNATTHVVEKQLEQRGVLVQSLPTNCETHPEEEKPAVSECGEGGGEGGEDKESIRVSLGLLDLQDIEPMAVRGKEENEEPSQEQQPRARFDSLSTHDSTPSSIADDATVRSRLKNIDSRSTVSSETLSAMNELDLIVAQAHDEASLNRRRRYGGRSTSSQNGKKKIAQILQKQLGVAITASEEYIEVQEESSVKSRFEPSQLAVETSVVEDGAGERMGAQANGLKSMLFNAQSLLLEASTNMHENDDETTIKELLMNVQAVVEVAVNKLEGGKRPRSRPKSKVSDHSRSIKGSLQHRGKFMR